MKYDFDVVCDRTNTNCAKWDAVGEIFGRKDVIPMWVADMDFPAAKPIVAALQKRAEHEFYGYTHAGPKLACRASLSSSLNLTSGFSKLNTFMLCWLTGNGVWPLRRVFGTKIS